MQVWRNILAVVIWSCRSWRVSQSWNNTLIILHTQSRADSFFITRKYHTKNQNTTSHLKVFIKRAAPKAKTCQKATMVMLCYSNSIGRSSMVKDITYTLLWMFLWLHKQPYKNTLEQNVNMNRTISFTSISSSNLNWVKWPWNTSLAFLGSWNIAQKTSVKTVIKLN